jgi:hypothetical protein
MQYRELDISRQAEQSRNYWKQKVEQCPPDMMAREFVQNGIESPRLAQSLIVRWGPYLYDGVTKLSVFNNGRGMAPGELERLADMAWSGPEKEQSRAGNKGIGARVAGLKNNKHGVVYLSCFEGRVYKIRLCYIPGVDGYGAELLSGEGIVREVTEEFTKLERLTDWVRVVFLGHSRDSDTTKDIGSKRRAAGWLPNEITYRFFRLPKDVEVLVDSSLTFKHKHSSAIRDLPVVTFSDCFDKSTSYDVAYSNGATIHYAHFAQLEKDDEKLTLGAASGISSIGAVCWRGELYDVMNLFEWGEQAKHFAIPYVGRAVCVVVELPDSAPVYASEYRDVLLWDGGDNPNKPVKLRHFQDSVIGNRPLWLIKLIEEKSKAFRRKDSDALKQFLAKVWAELHLLKLLKVIDNTGDETGDSTEQETWSQHDDHRSDKSRTKRERGVLGDAVGAIRGAIKYSSSPIPSCIFCWTEDEVKAANITMPVQYYPKPGEIYFDMRNKIVDQAAEELFRRIKSREKAKLDDQVVRMFIRDRIEFAMTAIVVLVIGAADFNRLVDPNMSALQAVTDESLSALFGVLKLPAVLDEIASSNKFLVTAA